MSRRGRLKYSLMSRKKRKHSDYLYSEESRRKLEKASDLIKFVGELTPLRRCKNGDHTGTCLICQPSNGPSTRKMNHFRIKRGNKFFKCFRCGRSGKLVGFVKQYYNVSYDGAFRIIYKTLPIEKRFYYDCTLKKRDIFDDDLPF